MKQASSNYSLKIQMNSTHQACFVNSSTITTFDRQIWYGVKMLARHSCHKADRALFSETSISCPKMAHFLLTIGHKTTDAVGLVYYVRYTLWLITSAYSAVQLDYRRQCPLKYLTASWWSTASCWLGCIFLGLLLIVWPFIINNFFFNFNRMHLDTLALLFTDVSMPSLAK